MRAAIHRRHTKRRSGQRQIQFENTPPRGEKKRTQQPGESCASCPLGSHVARARKRGGGLFV